MNLADEIKQRVKMPDVFARYGFEPNRGGFISCPFHSERTASLSAYHDGERWKCFGCGAGGDVISFVMLLFGINFSQALLRINLDFGLGLSNKQPDRRETIRLSAEKAEKEMEKQRRDQYLAILTECHRRLWNTRLAYRPKSPEELPCPQFVHALKETDRLEYLLEEALSEMR